MQSLDPEIYAQLKRMAKERGITMQELIRAVIVPDWMKKAAGSTSGPKSGRRVTRRLRRARATLPA